MAKRIGELLVEANLITNEQLERVLAVQRDDGRKLGHLLIEMKLVSETQLTQELSKQLAVPWVSLYHIEFSRSLLNLVPRDVAEKYSLVPIFVRKVRKQGDTLYVAMDDPTNELALAEVAKSAGMAVRPMIACPSDIKSAIRIYYGGEEPEAAPPSAAPAKPAPPPPRPSERRTLPEGQMPQSVRTPTASSPDLAAPQAAYQDIPEVAAESEPPPSAPPPSDDHPDAAPEIEAQEIKPKSRRRPGMIALTLLDGTTIALPSPKKRPSRPEASESSDQLTARDFISALRAVAHGADASEILGQQPKWEAMFAALLSLMLKKGLIADWEFVEEYRKV